MLSSSCQAKIFFAFGFPQGRTSSSIPLCQGGSRLKMRPGLAGDAPAPTNSVVQQQPPPGAVSEICCGILRILFISYQFYMDEIFPVCRAVELDRQNCTHWVTMEQQLAYLQGSFVPSSSGQAKKDFLWFWIATGPCQPV